MIPSGRSGFTFRVTRCHQFANLAMYVGEPEIYPPESCPELSPDILAHPNDLVHALEDFLCDIGVVPYFFRSMIPVIVSAIPRPYIPYFSIDVTLYLFSFEQACSDSDRQKSPPSRVRTGGESCSICLEDIHSNTKSNITMLPCFHLFHIGCIIRWLCSASATCPLCRSNVDVLAS